MPEIIKLLLTAGAGFGLGAFFFGGLWWTVGKGVLARHPAVLILASLLVRMGVTVAGFYFVSGGGQWKRLIACLVGFIVARTVVTGLVRSSAKSRSNLQGEEHDAP